MPSSWLCTASFLVATTSAPNSSYTNPIIPGWHSDPSCVFVPVLNDTLFCTTSTFLAFPGIPVYASNDFIDWKLASNALHSASQLPDLANAADQSDGEFAATLRYHDGLFYLITVFLSASPTFVLEGLIFTSANVYDQATTQWAARR